MSALAHVKVFADLPETVLGRLERSSAQRDLHDGEQCFAQGDAADALYAILGGEGRVRVGAIDPRSKALMVEVLRSGDVFGEIGILDGGVRTAEAVAKGRLRVMRIPAVVFLSVLQETPALGAALSRMLAHRLRRTFELFLDASFETLEVRLARQVLYLADLDSRRSGQGWRLIGRFRQPDLADLLGATSRSIITILNNWRAKGLVIYDGDRAQLTIADEDALRALVGTDPDRPKRTPEPGQQT